MRYACVAAVYEAYYILALVVRDQADALAGNIVRYELALREKGP